jgi:hypothetical protein
MRMRRVAILLLLLSVLLSCRSTVFADPRAEEILKEVRTAIGGEELLQKIQGLIINGHFRRMLAERQMAGDREISILLPDKFFIEDAFNPGGLSTAMINARGLNGERAWNSSSGGGGMIIRMGGPGGVQPSPEQMEAMFRRQYSSELTRYLLAILVTTSTMQSLECKYVGDSHVDDSPADVVEVSGPDRPAIRVFFDKKTHLPLLLSYRGPRPRVMTMTRQGGGTVRTDEEIKKAREEAEKKLASEPQQRPEEVDFFIRVEGHKKVNDLLLPHKLTFLTANEVSEEFEITKYQLNPQFKADKFQKD